MLLFLNFLFKTKKISPTVHIYAKNNFLKGKPIKQNCIKIAALNDPSVILDGSYVNHLYHSRDTRHSSVVMVYMLLQTSVQ